MCGCGMIKKVGGEGENYKDDCDTIFIVLILLISYYLFRP